MWHLGSDVTQLSPAQGMRIFNEVIIKKKIKKKSEIYLYMCDWREMFPVALYWNFILFNKLFGRKTFHRDSQSPVINTVLAHR